MQLSPLEDLKDKFQITVEREMDNLQKLVGRVPRLGKYQKQLQTLSRLRKLETKTKKEILTMPLHYEIETDGLYLEGIEKGTTEALRNFIIRMLQMGEFSKEKIALIANVDITYVNEIEKTLLDSSGDGL